MTKILRYNTINRQKNNNHEFNINNFIFSLFFSILSF